MERTCAASRLLARYRPAWPAGSFLAGLDRLDRSLTESLVDVGELVGFADGEELIGEGLPDTDVWLLLSSCAKVTAHLDRGGSALLAVRVGGDVVGELAAMDGGPRSATVTACGREPLHAVRLTGREFLDTLAARPDALVRLTESVGRKLRAATRRRVDFTGCPPLICLARVLVEMADDYGHAGRGRGVVLNVDLTQLEWGTLIGHSESSVFRAMRQLRDQRLVDSGSRRAIVRDIAALRAIAYP